MWLALLGLLVGVASATDVPSLWTSHGIGVAAYPTGLIYLGQLQVRGPLYRSESIVFQDTFAGGGLTLAASPAFINGGPRVDIGPIDVFDIALSAEVVSSIPGFGAIPYDTLGSKLERERNPRKDESFGAIGWQITANPTVKIKLGPVIAFDSFTLASVHLGQPDDVVGRYYYEARRDMTLAWHELYLENQPGLLFEASPGGDKPLILLGATAYDKRCIKSGDRQVLAGFLGVVKPHEHKAVPTIIGQATLYLKDPDRQIEDVPYLAMLLSWDFQKPLKKSLP